MLKLEKLTIDSNVELSDITGGLMTVSATSSSVSTVVARGVFEVNKNHRGTYATFDAVSSLDSAQDVDSDGLQVDLVQLKDLLVSCTAGASADQPVDITVPTNLEDTDIHLSVTIPEGSTADKIDFAIITGGKIQVKPTSGDTIAAGDIIVHNVPAIVAHGVVSSKTATCDFKLKPGRVKFNGVCRLDDANSVKPNLTHLSHLHTEFDV